MGSKITKSKPKPRRGQRTSDGSLIVRASRQAIRRIEHMDKSIEATKKNMQIRIKEYEKEKKKAQETLKALQAECEHPRLTREKGVWVCAVCLRPVDVNLQK